MLKLISDNIKEGKTVFLSEISMEGIYPDRIETEYNKVTNTIQKAKAVSLLIANENQLTFWETFYKVRDKIDYPATYGLSGYTNLELIVMNSIIVFDEIINEMISYFANKIGTENV